MLASAVAAIALFGRQDDLATAVALGFAYVFFNVRAPRFAPLPVHTSALSL
jgi:hypothetical protein